MKTSKRRLKGIVGRNKLIAAMEKYYSHPSPYVVAWNECVKRGIFAMPTKDDPGLLQFVPYVPSTDSPTDGRARFLGFESESYINLPEVQNG